MPTASWPTTDAPARDVLAIPDRLRGLVGVLPFVYLAWADGILTPSELDRVRTRLDALPGLSEEDRATVRGWLDPSDPPTTTQYLGWGRMLRRAARHVPEAAQRSLADLALALVELDGDADLQTEAARRALADLEADIGLPGDEALRELLAERPAPQPTETTSAFDVEALQALLDGPHAELRDRIRTLLSDPVFRRQPDTTTTAYRDQVLYWAIKLADQGLGALAFPEEQGGADDYEQFIVAFETLAYGDLSLVIKFGVQFGLFGGSVYQLGTEKHHERYLGPIGRLELPGCFAMSELGHGSNVRELLTTARFDKERDGFVINTPNDYARKEWIGNAARHGQMATVFAQLHIDGEDYGVHAFLAPIRDRHGHPVPRVRIDDCGHKMGLNGVDNGRLWFDNLFVPRENMLDRFAQVDADGTYHSQIPSSGKRFFTMLSTLVGGRISVAAAGLSAAKSGLTIAVRYGAQRRQFGPKDQAEVPILNYLTHQRRLFPLLATTYGLHFAVDDLRRRFANERHDDDQRQAIEGHASALKAFGTWHTTHTLQTAREACGGQGYLTVNRLPQIKADTDVFTTFEGDNTVLMLQVAKGLLSDYKQQFQDMNVFGMVRFLTEGAVSNLIERLPLVHRLSDTSGDLRDPAFQRAAFAQREQDLIRSAARRLKGRIDDGMDSYEAFIEVQDHLVTMAQAHVERLVLDRFSEAVEAADGELREPLGLLRDLYAVWHLERDAAWFLTHDYFSASKAEALRAEVNALCRAIRPHAVALVDAFGIPDAVLEAPIAVDTARYTS